MKTPEHGSIVRHVTGFKQYSVTPRTLDGFEFKEVDPIKINVEGMELEVLEGSVPNNTKMEASLCFLITKNWLTSLTKSTIM